MLPRQQAGGHGEDPGAQPAHQVFGFLAAKLARSGDEVGFARDDGRQDPLHLGRVVLAVGVGRHDVPGRTLPGEAVAQPERGALAAVHRNVADERAMGTALGHCPVLGAVRYHDDRGGEPAEGRRKSVDDRAEHAFLVEGGDHDGDRWQVGHAFAVMGGESLDGGAVNCFAGDRPGRHRAPAPPVTRTRERSSAAIDSPFAIRPFIVPAG